MDEPGEAVRVDARLARRPALQRPLGRLPRPGLGHVLRRHHVRVREPGEDIGDGDAVGAQGLPQRRGHHRGGRLAAAVERASPRQDQGGDRLDEDHAPGALADPRREGVGQSPRTPQVHLEQVPGICLVVAQDAAGPLAPSVRDEQVDVVMGGGERRHVERVRDVQPHRHEPGAVPRPGAGQGVEVPGARVDARSTEVNQGVDERCADPAIGTGDQGRPADEGLACRLIHQQADRPSAGRASTTGSCRTASRWCRRRAR